MTDLEFEGQTINAPIGDSIAAALIRAGWRGVFCGMGVCQECRVVVDGRAHVRACMTKITGAHRISRQPAFPELQATRAERPGLPTLTPDVAVLGAGAGGLSAAAVAAEAGLQVLLIDERPLPGGQYFKQPARPGAPADAQAEAGARLIARVRASSVTWLEATEAWSAAPPLDLAVIAPDGPISVRPRRLIVATGAYERAWPIPGWTLPGVMTTGAVQTLLRSYDVPAGRRVLLAGNGPLNLQVALELVRAGAEVVAVAELAPARADTAALLTMLRADPQLLARGGRDRLTLWRAGVKLLHGHCLVGVEPAAGGLRARLANWDGERLTPGPAFETDIVAMGYGFHPAAEIFRALGAAQEYDTRHRQLRTLRGADCSTNVPGLFGVGDCCGLGGAQAAQAEGVIAGLAAATSLGRPLSPRLTHEVRRARARLDRYRRFQNGLWRLFAAPDPGLTVATEDTVICRCEAVTLAQLKSAFAAGGITIGALKRLTRAGMGACQGRYCAEYLAKMIADRNGLPVDAADFFAPRPPLKPVRIGDLLEQTVHDGAWCAAADIDLSPFRERGDERQQREHHEPPPGGEPDAGRLCEGQAAHHAQKRGAGHVHRFGA